MNDNDIIKALECCSGLGKCKDCPAMQRTECLNVLTEQAYDLIKRQKAEIERLEAYNANLEAANSYICNTLLDKVSKARDEATKEFAERLKERVMKYTEYDDGGWDSTIYVVKAEDINIIAKEMTEE